MAGDKSAVARAQELERDIILKAKEESLQRDSSTTSSSPNRSSTFSTPRASSVAPTPKGSANSRAVPAPRKYVSPMAKAREERKRRAAAEAASETSKDWPSLSEMETSSTPSSGSMQSDASASAAKAAQLPKFGEWEKHSVNSGPCYTLLFQHAAQEKKTGGPVPVRSNSNSAPCSQDLYNSQPPSRKQDLHKSQPAPHSKSLKRKQFAFLCCFSS